MNEQLLEVLTDIVKALARDGAWVPIETYLAIYKSETREAVMSRRSKGKVWTDGVESKFVKGSGLWINLLAVNAWAAKSPLRLVSVPGSTTPESPLASASPSCSAATSAGSPSPGLAPTPANVRYAANLRGEILNAIARATFNYADYFPESERAQLLGSTPRGELVGAALDEFMAIARLAASTRLTYGRVIERYLRPWFGRARLRDLTAPMIRAKILAVRKEDEKTPVTLKTARNILAPLGSTLELAVGDGKIEESPMVRLKLERFWPEGFVESAYEADPFAWAEMEAIFAACEGGPLGEEADYFRCAFGTGMRPSEQIELAWPCVDLVQHRFRVEVARVTSKADPAISDLKIGSTVKAPKTRASRRDIDFTVGAWEALQRQQERTRLAGGHVWRDARYGAPWRSLGQMRHGSPPMKRSPPRSR